MASTPLLCRVSLKSPHSRHPIARLCRDQTSGVYINFVRTMPILFGRRKQKVRPAKASGSGDHGPKAQNPAGQRGDSIVKEATPLLDQGSSEARKAGLGVKTLYEPKKPMDAIVE